MIVYSNGCSHTAGACIRRTKTYPHAFMDYVATSIGEDNYLEWEHFIKPHKTTLEYEKLVENHKGDHLLVFNAHHGKSNDKIYYETIDFVMRMIRMDKKPDYVLIQWSGPNRRIFTPEPSNSRESIQDQVYDATPWDYTEKGIYFETYASKHTLQLMISLQDFLKKYGIQYVFIPYMELEKSPLQIETEVLDLSKFTTDPFVGHRNIFRFKGLACDEAGHPNELGNYFLLSKILEILDLEEFDKGMKYWDWDIKQHMDSHAGKKEGLLKRYWDKLGDGTILDLKNLDKFKRLI